MDPTEVGANAPDPLAAVNAGVDKADTESGAKDEGTLLEEKEVRDLFKQYSAARVFDKPQYKQVERDRSYASGRAGAAWAVNANLLGSYIDILVSFIYARNPKTSIRPAEQTGQAADQDRQNFAKTLQIVVQRMWKQGKLKKAMKRVVRAGFSVSGGWFKAVMLFDTKRDPTIESDLNDARDNMERIRALEDEIIEDESGAEPLTKEAKIAELERQIASLEAKVEVVVRKAFAIDFIATEQVQVALDVRSIGDYLEAGWIGDEIYLLESEARIKYPLLSAEDVKAATKYYQRAPTEYARLEVDAGAGIAASADGMMEFDAVGMAHQYSTSPGPDGDASGKAELVRYVKAIEIWDRRDTHIKTVVEGVKKWARKPFTPPFATSRFYPYFYVDFFDVDGERWGQSLTFRLMRLQDEYGAARSNFRLTRQRAIPGTFFNATQIEDENMLKVTQATQDEFVPIKPKDPAADLTKMFAPKPLPTIDPGLFDTSPIIGDMEKLSGVQEALQTSHTVQKTATQAEIEQSGFAARSTAERDCVEDALGDFAVYSAELALQSYTLADARKIAGPLAFWPVNMSVDDITSLLDVDIEAGSTARPNSVAEREAWAAVEPIVEKLITLAYTQPPGSPIVRAYIELARETLNRFDDRLNIERFLPGIDVNTGVLIPPVVPPTPGAPPGAPGAAPPVPVVPGDGGGPPQPAQPTAPAQQPANAEVLPAAPT